MIEGKIPLKTEAQAVGRILFTVAMLVAILFGVRAGIALLIPASWCAGTAVDPVIYVLSTIVPLSLALPSNQFGILPIFRFGVATLAGISLAVVAARLATGCTLASGWVGDSRYLVEALVMSVILIPLAVLHRDVIEPRWKSRG